MLAFLLVLGIVVIDQISKFLIRANLQVGEKVDFIPHVLGLTYSENTGASFGILKDARWVFMIASTLAIVALVVLLVYHYSQPVEKRRNALFVTSIAFVLGGGIGNMIDRLFINGSNGQKAVTDMFEVLFFDFAIFNVADSFITVGSVLLCVYLIFFETKYEKAQKAQSEAQDDSEKEDSDE